LFGDPDENDVEPMLQATEFGLSRIAGGAPTAITGPFTRSNKWTDCLEPDPKRYRNQIAWWLIH
jgi:hypothetical protein